MSSEDRSRRATNQKKLEKFETLKKLRDLNQKGIKNKYEIIEEQMVYEEVEEDKYAEIVNKRQEEDWIVDDDGRGYAEHGREIFDDDDSEDQEYNLNANYRREKNKTKNYRLLNLNKSTKTDDQSDQTSRSDSKKDIRSMFSSMTKKFENNSKSSSKAKKFDEVEIDDQEIESLVESITTPTFSSKISTIPSSFTTPQPLKLQKKLTKISKSANLTPLGLKRKVDSLQKLSIKRRSLMKTDFDFDKIVQDEEFNQEVKAEIVFFSKNSTDSNKVQIKLEDEDQDFELNDDYMQSDNTVDYGDFDENLPIKQEPDNLGVKIVKLPEEEWSFSNNNQQQNEEKFSAASAILPKEVPFEVDENGDKLIKFYWFDAFYDASSRCADTVFLFGKIFVEQIKRYVNCCVQVKNLERRIFLLPRKHNLDNPKQTIEMDDVRKEFSEECATKIGIKQFRSRSVRKKNAFDLTKIPAEAEYLEVLYPASHPPFPANMMSGGTYRQVFGVQTSILENLILDLNLMGPGWLVIKNPELTDSPMSWCRIELMVKEPMKQITVFDGQLSSPDFTVLSLCFKTYVHAETKSAEIIAVSCLVNKNFNFDSSNLTKDSSVKFDQHFCIITRPGGKSGIEIPVDFNQKMALKDYNKTRIERMNNERELLTFLMARFQQIDPDIIVGHDLYHFDYDILLQRMAYHKIHVQWSKLGRLKRSGLPVRNKDKHSLAGRLVCDIKLMARELIQKSKSYDLTELAALILKKGRFEIEQNLLSNFYKSSTQLIRLIEFLMKDNDLILSIMFELNCLQLTKQITNIAGNLLSRTLLGGRSERNEYLLLHAFHSRGYLVPDKPVRFGKKTLVEEPIKVEDGGDEHQEKFEKKNDPKKSSYTGGLVLEPKVGYYDRFILLMDFNSLYPSIIQEYNICFTTIKQTSDTQDDEMVDLQSVDQSNSSGILPTEIRKLVESRREVKRLLCDPKLSVEKKLQLDIKQKALKITANSMYGCLGYVDSRFYAKHLAALVTFKGREILLNTKELVEKCGYEVIYGDTDSIMILTDCTSYDQVRTIGSKIQQEVNKLYKLLEIDIDGVFRCMLLLKKKKYAALAVTRHSNGTLVYHREIKGLDIVRRDWSVLAKLAGEKILDMILLSESKPIETITDQVHQYLKQLAEQIRSNQIPLESFVINKALTKRPEDYGENGRSLTHVSIALRYNSSNLCAKKLSSGDTVPFVICDDGTKNAATQRGYHLEEVRSGENLKVDYNYYLSQQLLPVVSRLCDPIDGTDSGIIAEFLGIEHHFKRLTAPASVELDPALNCGSHKFDVCQSLEIHCPWCQKVIEVRDLFLVMNQRNANLSSLKVKTMVAKELFQLTLSRCNHCFKEFDQFVEFYVEIEIRRQINEHIRKFCLRWMICDDHTCNHRTRILSGTMARRNKTLACPSCKNGNLQLEISEHFLYQQLTFFCHIFDFDQALNRFNSLELNDEQRTARNELKRIHSEIYQRFRQTVQQYLDLSSYNEFDLGFLFRKFRYNH